MLCRSIPERQFEIEYDVMVSQGTIVMDKGKKFLRELEGHAGYFNLLKSPKIYYFHLDARKLLQNPDYNKQSYDFVSVFTKNDNNVVNTSPMKERW